MTTKSKQRQRKAKSFHVVATALTAVFVLDWQWFMDSVTD
jgi:hypothetical protein